MKIGCLCFCSMNLYDLYMTCTQIMGDVEMWIETEFIKNQMEGS